MRITTQPRVTLARSRRAPGDAAVSDSDTQEWSAESYERDLRQADKP